MTDEIKKIYEIMNELAAQILKLQEEVSAMKSENDGK